MQRCPQCTQELSAENYAPSHWGRPGTWCKGCRRAHYRKVRPATPPKDCETCGKTIERPVTYQRFCSTNCKMAGLRKRRREGTAAKPRQAPLPKISRAGQRLTAECKRCGQSFAYEYVRRPREVCDDCRKHDHDWTTFRLSGAEADALRAQARCDICATDYAGGRFGNWHIDHCHVTGALRGILCASCNTALGLFADDPDRLLRAAEYLRSHART